MDRDTDDSSNYVYAPLSLEVRPFRLARLKPALTRHAPIECTLIDSDIDTGGVEYEAVSYTWGTEWDADIVTVDNQVLSISLNLSLVFRDLRLPTVDRVLWIDAVCIDQRNDAERSHQVQQMGDMFRNAKRVLFCVGRPTEMTDMLFTVLFGLQTLLRESFPKQGRPVTCHEVRKSGILDKLQKRHYGFWSRLKQGFDTILQQPWFFRVWIIQEVANARQGRLYCGPVSVPTNLFVEALILFRVEPPPHCEQILRMMPGRHKKFTRKPLALLLQELADSQATDARDKVWALLDLCSDAEARTALKPDYTKTETDLIRDMIAYLCNCGTTHEPVWKSVDESLRRSRSMHRDVLKSLIAADDVENAAALLRKHSDKVQLTKEMFEEAYIWGETSRKHHNAYAEYVCKDKAQQLVMLLLQHASARSLMRRRRRHISGYAQREAAIDESLLLYASGRGHDDIIQRLIEIGVDIDVRSNVYLGIRSRFKVFETFAMPARKPLRTMTALECAAAAGHLNAVAILISNGAKLFYEYETLPTSMVLAVAQGHLKVVQFLMQRDEKVKYVDAESHLRLVKLAVQNGRCETTKFLLEHRIQVLGHARGMAASKDALQSHRSPSIVVLAMMSGCPDMLEIILSSGFHDGIGVREDLVTALEYAALMPNASFVYTLLRFGWEPTSRCVNWVLDNLHNNHKAMNPVLEALLDAHTRFRTVLDVSVVHNMTDLATKDGKENACCARYINLIVQRGGGVDWKACGIALIMASERQVPSIVQLLKSKGVVMPEGSEDKDVLKATRHRLRLDYRMRQELGNIVKTRESRE